MTVTFLVTYFAHRELLDVCIRSIKKYHPNDHIIVSQQVGDYPVDIEEKIIYHDMFTKQWDSAARGLMEQCETDIAVFIEHDAMLMRPLTPLINMMDQYDLIGPEEIIPFEKLNRNAPGMVCQNFFIINVKKMKEIGLDNIRVRDVDKLKEKGYNVESGYGISQSLDKKLFLVPTKSGYGHGTYYDNFVHHLWFGSYRQRNVGDTDDIDTLWLDDEVDRLISDYYNGTMGTLK